MRLADMPKVFNRFRTADGAEYYLMDTDLPSMRSWVFDHQTGTYHYIPADTEVVACCINFSKLWRECDASRVLPMRSSP